MTAEACDAQYPLQSLGTGAGEDQMQPAEQDIEPPSVKQEDAL